MPLPEQDLGRHLGRLDEPHASVARLERVLDLVLEAHVAERPLVALDQLGGVQVTQGLAQVVRVLLVVGPLASRSGGPQLELGLGL